MSENKKFIPRGMPQPKLKACGIVIKKEEKEKEMKVEKKK